MEWLSRSRIVMFGAVEVEVFVRNLVGSRLTFRLFFDENSLEEICGYARFKS